jgi:hypothetical protein
MTIEATRNKIEELIDNLNKTICMLKIKGKEKNKSILDEILGELDEKRKLVKIADEAQLDLIEAEIKYYTFNTNIYVTQATRNRIIDSINNLKKTMYMVKTKKNKSTLDIIIGNLDEKRKLVKKANDIELDIYETELENVKNFFEDKFENKIAEAKEKAKIKAKEKAKLEAKEKAIIEAKEKAREKAKEETEAKEKAREKAKEETEAKEKAREKAKEEIERKAIAEALAEAIAKTRAETEAKEKAERKAREEARAKEIALEEAILKAKIKEKAEEKAQAKIKEKADRIAQVLANKKAKAEEKAKKK